MKLLLPAIVVCAALTLAVVAFRAPERDYVAPTAEELAVLGDCPTQIAGELPEGCVVHSFTVQGMCCRDCTGKIYSKMKSAPGVVQAAVNFDQRQVDVVVPRDADVAALEKALRFDKYTATLLH